MNVLNGSRVSFQYFVAIALPMYSKYNPLLDQAGRAYSVKRPGTATYVSIVGTTLVLLDRKKNKIDEIDDDYK